MSQYTTELRYLIQQNYDFGLKDYPIFDESYRDVLNKKIMDEYFFREIGTETPGRFRHHLNHTMAMIMPYYNQLYESQMLVIDPLLSYKDTEEMRRTVDMDTTDNSSETNTVDKDTTIAGTEKVIGSSEATGTTVTDGDSTSHTVGLETTDEDTTNTRTEDKLSVNSDTPGGMISVGDLKTNTWASSAQMDNGTIGDIGTNDRTVDVDTTVTGTNDQTVTNQASSDTTVDTTTGRTEGEKVTGNLSGTKKGTVDTVDEYLKTKFGFTGNQSKLLMEYRKTFLNIDRMIVQELNTLFMGVY